MNKSRGNWKQLGDQCHGASDRQGNQDWRGSGACQSLQPCQHWSQGPGLLTLRPVLWDPRLPRYTFLWMGEISTGEKTPKSWGFLAISLFLHCVVLLSLYLKFTKTKLLFILDKHFICRATVERRKWLYILFNHCFQPCPAKSSFPPLSVILGWCVITQVTFSY